MEKIFVNNNIDFLMVEGEMARLTREKDWQNTALGSPENWQQSLKTLVDIILNSKFPMFLFWGPELICFYNDAYRPSLGIDGKHPSILGMRAEEAWTEIWDIIKSLTDQVRGGGGSIWSEDQLIPIYRNGKIEDVYWTFSYSPVKDESGKIEGVLVTCTETTDKVNVLRKLQESNQQLAFAIEAAELGTFDFNPLTNLFVANRKLRDLFGFPAEGEIQLQDAISTVIEHERQQVAEAIAQSLEYGSGGKFDLKCTIVNPTNHNEIIIHAKGIVAFNSDNIAYRLNGTLQDITEQNQFQKQLEKQVKDRTKELAQNVIDLDKMNKELQSFAYISSHDLQEPLRKIQTFVTRILEKEYQNLSETGKDYFSRMKNAAERMQALIDDLLAYSRTHTLEKDYKIINVGEIIDEIIKDLREEIDHKEAIIERGKMCDISIIPFQFRQLFYNLISNSLKFARADTPSRINIKSESVEGKKLNFANVNKEISYCHITFQDNGIGFEAEYNEKIFELFQRLHGKKDYEGTGIGLSIVKKIVENHKGIITAHGEEGKGATFDIYIPV
jgi:signal transduction histidine kinase